MAYFHLGRGVVLPTLTVTGDDIDLTTEGSSVLFVWTSRGWERRDTSPTYSRQFASADEAYQTWDTPVFAERGRLVADWAYDKGGAGASASPEVDISIRVAHGYDYSSGFRVFTVGMSDLTPFQVEDNSNGSRYFRDYYSPFGLAVYVWVPTGKQAGTGATLTFKLTPIFKSIGD